jgi:hypothetical protein
LEAQEATEEEIYTLFLKSYPFKDSMEILKGSRKASGFSGGEYWASNS